MQEFQVWSLGQKDPLEKEVATHSSIIAWRIPWMKDPLWLLSMGSKESDATDHAYILTKVGVHPQYTSAIFTFQPLFVSFITFS